MNKIITILAGIGSIIAMVVGIFFQGKSSGKQEAKNEQNEQVIKDIDKYSKVVKESSDHTDDDILNKLHDPNSDK